MKPKVYVLNGLGIGCHKEVAHAYKKAGAEPEIVHIREILFGNKDIFKSQILNLSGGFLHGDILGAGICAANELECTRLEKNGGKPLKEILVEFADKGNIIYGQCNGFQLLVKTGLLPAIDNDYSQQTVTLTHNDCGNYRVAPVFHTRGEQHFAFIGIDDTDLWLWCRHGEGKIRFSSDYGLIPQKQGEKNRKKVNKNHVLLRYANPTTGKPTEEFPHNPNGSIDGIAGLMNSNGNIFGHMAHPEASIYISRDPRFFKWKDTLRRQGIKPSSLDGKILEGVGLKIFKNIVKYVKN